MQHLRIFLLSLFVLTLFVASASQAGDPLAKEKQQLPPGVVFLATLLENCMKLELGGDAAFETVVEMGHQAQQQITGACKAKDNTKARQIALHYAATREGKAAFACAAKLKPTVQEPYIQELLGKNRGVANALVSGQVPSKICL